MRTLFWAPWQREIVVAVITKENIERRIIEEMINEVIQFHMSGLLAGETSLEVYNF